MNILIIESEKYGHNLYIYLSALLKKFSKKNKIFLLTSAQVNSDKKFKILKKNLNFKVITKNFPKKSKKYNFFINTFYQIKYYFFLKKTFNKIQDKYLFEHIYINNVNHFDKAISLFGNPFKNINFSVFYTNLNIFLGDHKYSQKRPLNLFYYFLFCKFYKIKNLQNIFISNPILKNFLKEKDIAQKIQYVEEFSILENEKTNFNLLRNLNQKKKILVYGRIRDDKDIENLFGLLTYKYARDNLILIIAGHQELNISKYIKSIKKKFNNIISINHYIDEKFENYLFHNSDFVWVGYKKNFFGSSAVFFQASIANKPIICSSHGLVAWLNNFYKIGLSVNLDNSKKIINFIKSNKKINRSNFKKINHIHNENNFVNNIYKTIVKI